jgi:DNA (cytosine-5)-methyltransferase 1
VADGSSLFGRLDSGPVIVDLFAGGGGASEGIRMATGRGPIVAINHCAAAIAMHSRNHPETIHFQESVFDVRPQLAARGRPVDLLWASPDCTHFSRAKGGAPRSKEIRSLAWVIVDWAREVRPRVIAMENVPEFVTWGPLGDDGQPVKAQAGETFREFVQALEGHGYTVAWRVLNAADYGTPTSRKRLFLVARCDGAAIVWPEPTHGAGRLPYRTAAECIDWSIPVPSIFGRKRPLAEATERRIAEGIRRYVLGAARPFLVNLTHGGRLDGLDDPMKTVTAAHRGEKALVTPTLIQTGYGEREGQAPRVLDIGAPLGTVVAGGAKHALVAAFLAKHYGGVVGQPLDRPLGTVTATDHHSLVTGFLAKAHSHGWDGNGSDTRPLGRPVWTVTAKEGGALVAAFLARYYGQGGQWSGLDAPVPTVTTLDRMAVVTVSIDGEPYVLADIGMRMLQPRELATAQGFPASYVLTGTKSEQVARVGNSVCPPVACAIVEAQLGGGLARGAA